MSEYTLFHRQKEVESKLMAARWSSTGTCGWQDSRCPARIQPIDLPGRPRTLVVICPSIAKGVWQNEQREMGLELPTLVLDGITKKRAAGLRVPGLPQMIIANWRSPMRTYPSCRSSSTKSA